MFGNHSRDDLRQAYIDAWKKRLAGLPLTPQDALIADVIGLHPEYQAMMAEAERAKAFEQNAAQSTENPFLHMGLHIAVREQLSIDRPPGIRELHRTLRGAHDDPHAAEHILMDALAQTLWEAQRSGRPPDEARYLDLARAQLKPVRSP